MKQIGILLFSLLVLIACNKPEEKEQIKDTPVQETPAVSPIQNAAMGNLPTTYSSETAPAVATATPEVTQTTRINPPHGEPGHLCEYEVGAPIPVENPVASNQALAPGTRINPPHGEAGHLCEYEVGAVIPANVNGALPQQVNVQAAANRPTPITPSMTSTLSRPINKSVPVGPKPQFNPEHGQPWHNCDLPVGAPLS